MPRALRAPTEPFFLLRNAAGYWADLQHFAKVVAAERSPNPSGIDGCKAQVLTDAAQASFGSALPHAV